MLQENIVKNDRMGDITALRFYSKIAKLFDRHRISKSFKVAEIITLGNILFKQWSAIKSSIKLCSCA